METQNLKLYETYPYHLTYTHVVFLYVFKYYTLLSMLQS